MYLHEIIFIFILQKYEKIDKHTADSTGNYWNTHLFYSYTKRKLQTFWKIVMEKVWTDEINI